MTSSSLAFVFPGQGSQSLGMLGELAAARCAGAATPSRSVRRCRCRPVDAVAGGSGRACSTAPNSRSPRCSRRASRSGAPGRPRGGAQPARARWPQPGRIHRAGRRRRVVAARCRAAGARARPADAGRRARRAPARWPPCSAPRTTLVARGLRSDASGDEVVVPANYNSPGQIVIGGHAAAVDRAHRAARRARRAQGREARGQRAVAYAADARGRRAARRSDGRRCRGSAPRIPVVQNVDAQVHDGVPSIRDALVRQLYLPVQWTGCVQALAARGVTRIAECGPGKVLVGAGQAHRQVAGRARARHAGASSTPRINEWSNA